MKGINFKRKTGGGGNNWGAGLDYLLRDLWSKLDKLIRDNYYGKHNTALIRFLRLKVFSALENSISEMKRICGKNKRTDDWARQAKKLLYFGISAKNLRDKVIFIDTATQFLRETSIHGRQNQSTPIRRSGPSLSRNISTIRGIAAASFSKSAQGKVRIIFGGKDFSKFKKGEILAAHETNANFLSVMRKARAIITDNGGSLCHAAITSRELGIPCIVGTKIATQVLKDGDLVEVDANKGIVRILKKK